MLHSMDAKRIYKSAKAYCAGRCVAINKSIDELRFVFVHNRGDSIIHYKYCYNLRNDTFNVNVDRYKPRNWKVREL